MILYFIFLFLVPFQEHHILGAQLFHVGSFPVTPIKLVGIPLVVATLLLSRPRDAAPRPSTGILLLFAAFALFQVLGTTLSSLRLPASDASLLFSAAILMFATNILISSQRRLRMTIRVIVLVETFASIWLYKQYYIDHSPRPSGPSMDSNYEALSLVMTVPLAIWLARYDQRDLWKWAGRICTPILTFAVFLSQSRGGVLALIVMTALAWVNSRHKMRLVVGFTVATALMVAIGPGQTIKRFQQIQFQGQWETGPEASTRARVELARAGLHMMEAHPVFGVGLGQFKSVVVHYNPMLTSVGETGHIAHNTYVQLGAEGGIPTLALYLAILGVTLATCRASQKLPGVPEDISALALSFQIGLIGAMVAGIFISAQYVKETWIFISLAPNLYALSVQAAAMSRKTVSAQPKPAKQMALRPRLRTG
ncbi:O-antigen ligase family protein [Candidatus Binatus soli]|uniref:O-antigen ligase family protein n=1 Tax=Candidatus Binatus soli TaxID=1953413 RepID=UPI003D0AAC59